MKKIILASTSPYRKAQFEKLGIHFTTQKPLCDEENLKNLIWQKNPSPLNLAEELSFEKAISIFNILNPTEKENTLIIAGDQLVQFNNEVLGKTPNPEQAFIQLKKLNGQTHELITSVILLSHNMKIKINHISTMKMKNLTDSEIRNYLNLDQPFDCAGTYKIELHGALLFEKIITDDFTAIQGLPLLWLSQQFKELNYELFSNK